MRISRPDSDHKTAGRAGKAIPKWHHLDCFVKKREEYDFIDGADKLVREILGLFKVLSLPFLFRLAGFSKLTDEDQKSLEKKLKAL